MTIMFALVDACSVADECAQNIQNIKKLLAGASYSTDRCCCIAIERVEVDDDVDEGD